MKPANDERNILNKLILIFGMRHILCENQDLVEVSTRPTIVPRHVHIQRVV